MNVEQISFRDRSGRSEYVARRFQEVLKGKVLAVSCDKAVLRKLLPQVAYMGVDIGGTPDIQVNLEAAGRLPFADGSHLTAAFAFGTASDAREVSQCDESSLRMPLI
jgi:hypothetical protein